VLGAAGVLGAGVAPPLVAISVLAFGLVPGAAAGGFAAVVAPGVVLAVLPGVTGVDVGVEPSAVGAGNGSEEPRALVEPLNSAVLQAPSIEVRRAMQMRGCNDMVFLWINRREGRSAGSRTGLNPTSLINTFLYNVNRINKYLKNILKKTIQ